jgi:hypothetical protein
MSHENDVPQRNLIKQVYKDGTQGEFQVLRPDGTFAQWFVRQLD